MSKLWMRRALVVMAFAAPLPFGCRAVLGIGDYELSDAGAADHNVDPFSCEAYCDTIMAKCTGKDLQFENTAVCLGYCESIPKGTPSDQSGNTLGCRITRLASSVEPDCPGGGPTGDGTCGSDCESFCTSAGVLCSAELAILQADAGQSCEALLCAPDCKSYRSIEGSVPADPSYGCRMWHLAAAAEQFVPGAGMPTPFQTEHCQHVVGFAKCPVIPDSGICATLGGDP